jgi:hypothetical protein
MTVTLFHGGVPGLAVGDELTPASTRFSGERFQYGSTGEPPYDPNTINLRLHWCSLSLWADRDRGY